MNVRILLPAQQELDAAVAWYDQQAVGLGKEFLDELDRVIRRILLYPLSAVEIEPGLRRGLLARFPYGIIYGRDADVIVVVAVAHLHREPRYWSERLK